MSATVTMESVGRYDYPIEIASEEEAAQADAAFLGVVYVWRDELGWNVSTVIRPNLGEDGLRVFRKGVDERLDKLLETNAPDENGWFESDRFPGRWFMYLRPAREDEAALFRDLDDM